MTPFSVVDELSCYYDAPGEPNNVHLEVRLPGLLDEAAFRAAAAEVLARVPRARARRVRLSSSCGVRSMSVKRAAKAAKSSSAWRLAAAGVGRREHHGGVV